MGNINYWENNIAIEHITMPLEEPSTASLTDICCGLENALANGAECDANDRSNRQFTVRSKIACLMKN